MPTRDLITDLIPHAPRHGLYVGDLIPPDKLQAAITDYAASVSPASVLALYDATLLGNARDGALFLNDRLIFENNDLHGANTVFYRDIVGVKKRRRLLGGSRVVLDVNRGRATFQLDIDFSGKPKAASYVVRFINEAMLLEPGPSEAGDRLDTIRARLGDLHEEGVLSSGEVEAIMQMLTRGRL